RYTYQLGIASDLLYFFVMLAKVAHYPGFITATRATWARQLGCRSLTMYGKTSCSLVENATGSMAMASMATTTAGMANTPATMATMDAATTKRRIKQGGFTGSRHWPL